MFNATEVHKSIVFVTSHTCAYCVYVCVILVAEVTEGEKEYKNLLFKQQVSNTFFSLPYLSGHLVELSRTAYWHPHTFNREIMFKDK